MTTTECVNINSRKQNACDILPFAIDSLEICNESPPSYGFQSGNIIHKSEYNHCKDTFSDNSDSGFGTGSDDDSLTTSEQQNTPESPENLDSNNIFDFLKKRYFLQADKDSTKSNEITSLNPEVSFSNSSKNALLSNEEPEMTLTDLLSAIDVENSSNNKYSTVTFKQISSAINVLQETKATNFESNVDHPIKRDSFKYIATQENNSDGTHKFTSYDSIDNIHSDFNSTSVKSMDASHVGDAGLSDLLISASFDDSNESMKHHNLLNSSILCNKSFENANTSSSEVNLGYSKDYNDSLGFTNNSDFSLSDMLASICFEEDNCRGKYGSDFIGSNTEFYTKTNEVKQIDIKTANNFPSQNLDSSEKETEVSLAALAEKHLSLIQVSNLASSESEIQEVSLPSLADKHVASTQASSQITCNFRDRSQEVIAEFSRNSEPSVEIKTIQAENGNIDNDLSMLDLLSSLNINEICSEKEYLNNNSTTCLLDGTISENDKIVNDETNTWNEPDLVEVDLTTCLKTNAKCPNLPSNNIIKKDEVDNFTEIFNLSAFCYSPAPSHSVENNLVSSNVKAVRGKSNKSLFAKALSCKPRKNFSAMCKVLNLKKNLCNHFFQPLTIISTVPSENLSRNTKTVFADQTNSCVTTPCGIRTFSP